MNRQKFEIYRPAIHRQRLEGQYFTPDRTVWTPSTTYKAQLAEIKMQFTPAQAYKHRLQTTGKEIRMLQRLEWKWQRNFERWTILALRVQSCYRGFKGRQYFKSVRENLVLQHKRKECKHLSTLHFREGNKLEALRILSKLSFEEKTSEIRMITLRTLYCLRMFSECECECDRVLRIDKLNEDAHYIKACSFVSREMFEEAYSALRVLFGTFEEPHPESYRLNGLVSARLNPPRYEEVVESFGTLVYKRPEDMNALLLRANAYACTQSFREAVDDVDIILKFQLNLPNALYMRARLNCCLREYAEAKSDVFQLEKTAGVHNEYYIYAAMEVSIVSEDLPMLDEATRAEADNNG